MRRVNLCMPMSASTATAVPALKVGIPIIDRRILRWVLVTRRVTVLVRRVVFVLLGVRVWILVVHVGIVCTLAGTVGSSGSEVVLGHSDDVVRLIQLGHKLSALAVRGRVRCGPMKRLLGAGRNGRNVI